MDKDQFRRSSPVFPMSSAIRLTGLSARQIRYYEEKLLVSPARSDGGTRLFSMNDLDTLLDIKMYLEKGFKMDRVGEILSSKDVEIDIMQLQARGTTPVNRSDLSRFFKN